MRSLLCLCVAIFLAETVALADSQVYAGYVKDASGNALYGAGVVAYSAEGKILAYATVASDGSFELKAVPGTERIVLSCMGYVSATLSADEFVQGRVVVLEESRQQLREVAVKAERIVERGDTLSYSVAGFRQAQDRSIADVINKMPGLEVKTDGKIEYQGKAISNFYIEGLDLMGSGYSLASNNIPADKVKEVQVLENHQKIKSLRHVSFSETAALNLVLKDDGKAVWTALADLGLGYAGDDEGLTYDNRLMAMNFSKNFQTIMMYKNNNTGEDIGGEVQDIADLDDYKAESGMMDVTGTSGPSFDDSRYEFNASHLLAANWLFKTGKDSELRVQLNGFHDNERRRSLSSVSYLTIDGEPSVTEEYELADLRNEVKGELCYTLNSERNYLRSRTRVYADWNSTSGEALCNDVSTSLMYKTYKRVLSEDLTFSHTTSSGDVLQFVSSTGNTWLPGQLLALDGSVQQLDMNLFSTSNAFSFNKRIGRQSLKNTLGFDCKYQGVNGLNWSFLNPYWNPSLQLSYGRHKFSASVKVSYACQTYEGESVGQFWAEPRLSWRFKISPKSELSLGYSLTAKAREVGSLVSEPTYTSYRNVYVGTGTPGVQFSNIVTGSYLYRNPVNGIFFNFRPVYIRTSGNVLYESSLVSDVYLRSATDEVYDSDTYMLNARLAKTFIWARTNVGLNAYCSSTGYSFMSSGEVRDARLNINSFSLDYSMRPARWLSLEGKSGVRMSRNTLSEGGENGSLFTDWSHFLELHFVPASGWMLSLNNELYQSNDDNGLNYFCDLSLSYKTGRWEISLLVRNLPGSSEYRYETVSASLYSYRLSYLRPREALLKFSIDF